MHDISHVAGLRDTSFFRNVFEITEAVRVNLGSSSAATEWRGTLSESSSSEDSESDDSVSVLSSSSSIISSCFISSIWKYKLGFTSWEIGDCGTSIIPVKSNSSTAVRLFLELR